MGKYAGEELPGQRTKDLSDHARQIDSSPAI